MSTARLGCARIVGISCAAPKNTKSNADFENAFSAEEIGSVSKLTGVESRRIADENTCASDLCEAAATALMDDLGWTRDSISTLIFISQTPDYVLPPTSARLQAALGLPSGAAAFDVNLGCSGYVYGLWLAMSLLSAGNEGRTLLLVGDTCSKFVSPYDRATALLFGDAGSATALECAPGSPAMAFELGTDGAGAQNLIVPGGGFRRQSSEETLRRVPGEDGAPRSQEDLYMNGGEIFNFTLETVAPLVKSVVAAHGAAIEEVDYFVFHQANRFMVNHIAKKLRAPAEKVPLSIEKFGNTSSASIPLTLVTELGAALTSQSHKVVMAGFGVGYSWGAAVGDIGPLACARLVEV